MTTTKQWDFLNRLASISSSSSSSSSISFNYLYNQANQRVQCNLADASLWKYEYDPLGQLKSGRKFWPDQSPVAGQQFEYTHDDIGNRTQTKSGGDANGWNLRIANYSANSLNQYTNRDVPGYADIMGQAFATSSVTVNALAAYRKGEYFRKELAVDNSSAALWTNVVAAATGQTSVTGNVFVAKTQETFGYDADGNTTNDGRWAFTWDAENRLTQVESLSTAPTGSKRKVIWEFDAAGRRIRDTTYDGSSGTYVLTNDLKLLSDGWRHIADLNATNNAPLRSYAWGLDLSGTPDGAGGIGGLLMLNSAANAAHFYAYDGNGNVTALVGATNGAATATYEYDAFGRTLRATGLLAKENIFRFSTKRASDSTDLVLFEYRPYAALVGRWLGHDPAEESGGPGLYTFCANGGVGQIDPYGDFPGSPRLIKGTTLNQPLSTGGNATTTIERRLHERGEIHQVDKALCLIKSLIGKIYYPYYEDLYIGSLKVDASGYTFEYRRGGNLRINPLPNPAPSNGDKWSVIDTLQFHQFLLNENTLSMVAMGTLVAHEADHYWTGSSEATAWKRVNAAVQNAVRKALQQKVYMSCANGQWEMRNQLDYFACCCGIIPSKRSHE